MESNNLPAPVDLPTDSENLAARSSSGDEIRVEPTNA